MIGKIKEMMGVKHMVDSVNKELKTNSCEVSSLSNDVKELKAQIQELSKLHLEFKKDFEKNTGKIDSSQQTFDAEIKSFKDQKKNMQKIISADVEAQMKIIVNDMKKHIGNYKDLEKEIGSVVSNISKLNDEMKKFQNISKTISEKDFELIKFGKMLERNDKEKVELMKKIDSLERLMAAMQRGKKHARH